MSNNLQDVSKRAEANLNTYQAKTGGAPTTGLPDAATDALPEDKIDFSDVNYREDLKPSDKANVQDISPNETPSGRRPLGQGYPDDAAPPEGSLAGKGDILREGQVASHVNVGRKPPGPGGSQYKGEDYYVPESVPDSTAAEGLVPPDSVTEASKETEGYGR